MTHPAIRGKTFWFYSCNSRYRRGQQFLIENTYAFVMIIMHVLSSCMIPLCFWDNLLYFDASIEDYLDVYFYDPKLSIVTICFLFITRTNFHYVNPLYLNHCVTIKSMSPFIFINFFNKWITTNHDTQPDNNEK